LKFTKSIYFSSLKERFVSFELIGIEEGKYTVETDEEKLTIKLIPIVLNVVEEEGKVGIILTSIISATTEKPKFGPLCDPVMTKSKPSKIISFNEEKKAKFKVKVKDKIVEGVIKVTNISVYGEYRDPVGSPCVIVNTVVLY